VTDAIFVFKIFNDGWFLDI